MKFWKMNGAGNDFIIINNIEEKISMDSFSEIAKTVCERHLSIGADGLMVVEKATDGGDYKMLFYNSDGSMGEMCGNGARCISRYGYENKLAGKIQHIETTAGLVVGEQIDLRNYRVRLNDPSIIKVNQTATVEGKDYEYTYIELGNPGLPHIAVPMENLEQIPEDELFRIGKALRYYKDLPKGANVNFYELIGDNLVYERTWERGVEGFTYACGTGTGSVALALTLQEKVSGKQVKIDMRGGTLLVDVVMDNDKVTDLFLTGPTNIVAKGVICDEELILEGGF